MSVIVSWLVVMNTRSFYGTKTPSFTRHLRYFLSTDVPDDGNVSVDDQVSSDAEGNVDDADDTDDDDFIYHLANSDADGNDSSSDGESGDGSGDEWSTQFYCVCQCYVT